MRGPPEAGDPRRDARERVGPGRSRHPHRRGRGVLLVVGVQDEDPVHGAGQDRVGHILLGRHGEAHAQEVLGVGQLVARRHERLSRPVLERPGRDGRHLGDQPMGRDLALLGIADVDGIRIEGRQGADGAGHHPHGVRVAAEALEEAVELGVQHRVIGDVALELGVLGRGRQLAVEQQVGHLEEVRLLGQVVDRIAAVQQNPLVAVDEGDLALATRRRGEGRVVGEDVGLAVELADIDHVGAESPL